MSVRKYIPKICIYINVEVNLQLFVRLFIQNLMKKNPRPSFIMLITQRDFRFKTFIE
jgi:hypothetical protein